MHSLMGIHKDKCNLLRSYATYYLSFYLLNDKKIVMFMDYVREGGVTGLKIILVPKALWTSFIIVGIVSKLSILARTFLQKISI